MLSRLTAFLAEPARVLMSRVGELEPLARVAGPWGKKRIYLVQMGSVGSTHSLGS